MPIPSQTRSQWPQIQVRINPDLLARMDEVCDVWVIGRARLIEIAVERLLGVADNADYDNFAGGSDTRMNAPDIARAASSGEVGERSHPTRPPWLNAPRDLAVRPVWCHVVIDDGLGAAFAEKVARWIDDDGAQYALDGRRVEPAPILDDRSLCGECGGSIRANHRCVYCGTLHGDGR